MTTAPTEAAARSADAPSAARALTRVIAMEWTKLASVRTTWWCLGLGAAAMAVFALLMGISAIDRFAEDPDAASGFSYVQLTSQGVFYLVQFVVLTLAALAATNEYANRSITATLLVVPRRGLVLAARTIVVAGVSFAAAAAITVLGIGVLWLVVGSYTPLDAGYAARTVAGAGACMALFAVLFVGLGTALRGIAGTIGAGFLLLLGIPMVLQLSGSELVNDLAAVLPGFAGVEFYASGDAGFYTAPHDGAVNVVSVIGWAVAAQLAGYAELRVRDA